MHDPETPPTRILDIGTGNGLWAIEAAKLWKVNSPHFFRGIYDLTCLRSRTVKSQGSITSTYKLNYQACLKTSLTGYNGSTQICLCILHINLYNPNSLLYLSLKQLPFPSSYFDIVHVSRLAIHVPEDRVCLMSIVFLHHR